MPKLISLRPIATEFQNKRWRVIKSSWDVEVGHRQVEDFAIASLKPIQLGLVNSAKSASTYLAFLKYPECMRKSFSTTNVVEAINGQLEIMRRNRAATFILKRP